MCFVCIPEERVTFSLYSINKLVFKTEVESVYRAVRTDSLYTVSEKDCTPFFYVEYIYGFV